MISDFENLHVPKGHLYVFGKMSIGPIVWMTMGL